MAYRSQQKGFTIVELMIAISVFAVAITLITMGVLVISRQYQQGSTRTKLEAANREIHQTITQAVQFAGATPKTSNETYWKAFCAGTQRFVFANTLSTYDGTEYNNLKPGLYLDSVVNDTCPAPSVNGVDGIALLDRNNLLPSGAKVVKFEYSSNLFSTKFVTSDADLLNLGAVDAINCKANVAGKEFCAVVQLQSSATRRINN